MGGPGSGRKGSARGADGRFVMAGEITMVVVGAVESIKSLTAENEKLKRSLNSTTESMKTNKDVSKDLQKAINKSAKEMGDMELASIKTMVTLQSLTSASNQLTGATYKMIAGAEASNFIDQERAVQLQETARRVELLTGAFEFLLAIEILLQVAGWSMMPTLTAITGGMAGVAAATWAAVAPMIIFTGWVLLVVGVFAILIGIIYIAVKHWEDIAKMIGVVNAGFTQMLDLVLGATGAVTGLTSSLGGIGDAFTDNPVTRGLAKAGGAIF